MTDPIRIPLVEDIEPRLAGSNKDGLASNVFYDKGKNNTIYAVKRPGITSYISGSGLAQGIFTSNNQIFQFQIGPPQRQFSVGAFGGNRFVFGDGQAGLPFTDKIIYSLDGISWEVTEFPQAIPVTSITYINGYFYLLPFQTGTTIYRSSDATSWETISLPASANWKKIAFNGTDYVLAGSSKVLHSTDGTTFTDTTPFSQSYDTVVWNGSIFITLGPTRTYSSADGVSWTNTGAGGITGIVDGAANVSTGRVLVTRSDFFFWTDSGTSWTMSTPPSIDGRNYNKVIFDGSNFVSMFSGSNIVTAAITSSNGVSWTTHTSISSPAPALGIAFGNGKYVIGKNSLGGTPTIMAYSSTLDSWTITTDVNEETITITPI